MPPIDFIGGIFYKVNLVKIKSRPCLPEQNILCNYISCVYTKLEKS